MEDLGLVIKSQLFAYYSEQCSVTVSANDTDWQTSRGTDSVSSVLLSMYIGTRLVRVPGNIPIARPLCWLLLYLCLSLCVCVYLAHMLL